MLCGSSSRCHGLVCSVWLWYFLIILTFWCFSASKTRRAFHYILGWCWFFSKKSFATDFSWSVVCDWDMSWSYLVVLMSCDLCLCCVVTIFSMYMHLVRCYYMYYWQVLHFIIICNTTCVKRRLKNRQNKELNDKCQLNEGHTFYLR